MAKYARRLDDSSQVPAIVRQVRPLKGDTWQDKVKEWQRRYNANAGASAPKLKVDGLAGPATRRAMQQKDRNGDFRAPPQDARARGARGTKLSPAVARQEQVGSERQRQREARSSHQQLASQVRQVGKERAAAANRSTAWKMTPGETTETLYERMKGDPDWARRYRQQRGRETVPVSTTSASRSDIGPGRSNTRFPSEAATLRNLRPWERRRLEELFTQSVVRSKGRGR